jgi:pimeloyl-ACP methyl ester carboxylesterase
MAMARKPAKPAAARRKTASSRRTRTSAPAAAADSVALPPSPIDLADAAVEEALRTGDQPGLLEDLFGPAGYAELRQLARQASARSVRGGERVLILHGIMGSKLGFPGRWPFQDVLWIDPVDIFGGRLGALRLGPGGDPGKVRSLGVLLAAYLALKLRLRIAGHDAEFWHFDWRLGLARLGAELARAIDDPPGRTTHLVAHSMGGLVARAALKHAPKNLEKGRVVTLGTPNFGSYSPVQAFRGVHSVVGKIAFIDTSHDPGELAGIFGTFPGLLEMIPSPERRPSLNLFKETSWPRQGTKPSPAMLAAAAAAQAALPRPDQRFLLIVGNGSETVVDARLDAAKDELVYDLSTEGDGTVPLDLAVVPGRDTWVTTAGHGGMPNSASVARAVDELLATGTTSELPKLDAAGGTRGTTPMRSVADHDLAARLPAPGQRGRALAAREQRTLLEEFAAPPERDAATVSAAPAAAPATTEGAARLLTNYVVMRRQRQRLDIDLVCGSITDTRADAYVIGVFRNVAPGGAAGAVDQELDGALRQLIERRMVSGDAGEVTSFPTGRHRFGAQSVILAGLGSVTDYSDDVLELVGENVMRTALLTRLDDFAIVPIGASTGGTASAALEHLLRGFVRALIAAPDARLRGLTICELDPDRYRELRETFHQLLRSDLFGEIEVTLNERELPTPAVRRGPAAPRPMRDAVYLLTRQEVARNGQASVVASVLTSGGKAAILQGRIEIDDAELERHARNLARRGLPTAKDADAFGEALGRKVLAAEIRDVLARELGGDGASPPLVVVHDAPTSRIPWETLRIGQVAPALAGGLTHRYDGGVLSVAKWNEERAQTPGLSMLLVVDPTEDLQGAEEEGKRIEAMLRTRPAIRLTVLAKKEARRNTLIEHFQSGDYDVVHYAGHAFFDPDNRGRSGLICAGEEVLSGADLAALRQLPSLVFFNACEAARVRKPGKPQAEADEPIRSTISFAESFLAGGVANYLGTYWPVGDLGAAAFADTFYTALLKGDPIGLALIQGRRKVRELKAGDWANYVLYGNPEFRLTPG